MNQRKPSFGLTPEQIKELSAAAYRAKRIGLPMTTFATFNPAEARGLTPTETTELLAAIRNKLGVTARRLGFYPAFAWVIEAKPDGSQTHMHAMVHVPAHHAKKFKDVASLWLPENRGVVVKPITDLQGLLFYFSKQREGGSNVGLYAGKRFGVSELLRTKPMVYAIKGHSEPVTAHCAPL